MWQCAGDVETKAREPCEKMWKLPPDFRFQLDLETMRASGSKETTCPECGGKGRPNVPMFHDVQWIANKSEEVRETMISLSNLIACGGYLLSTLDIAEWLYCVGIRDGSGEF